MKSSLIKKFLWMLVVCAVLFSAVAVGAQDAPLNVAAMTGPTAMGLARLMDQAETNPVEFPYVFDVYGTPDEVVTDLVTEKLDAAAIPCNLASVLYNKTEGKIGVAAINTLGVLYMVETGDTVKSVDDLKGQTIYALGKGATPDMVLTYVLQQNGLDPQKDVTIEFKSEATEIAAMMKETTEPIIALLPQPFVTVAMMQNDKVRIALDMTEEWNAVTDGNDLVTGCLVVRKPVLEDRTETFEKFMADYAQSAQFANDHIEETAALIEKIGIVPKAAIAAKALPYCNITLITGADMKKLEEAYLNVLFSMNPKTIGGKLPGEDFYVLP